VLVSAAAPGEPCSLLGVDMHSDGSGHKSLNAEYSGGGGKPMQEGAAGSAHASYGNVAMAGSDVFKFAVRSVPAVRGPVCFGGWGWQCVGDPRGWV
jgi:3-oxoacyl-[acyl-carrier-protein] synthase III